MTQICFLKKQNTCTHRGIVTTISFNKLLKIKKSFVHSNKLYLSERSVFYIIASHYHRGDIREELFVNSVITFKIGTQCRRPVNQRLACLKELIADLFVKL